MTNDMDNNDVAKLCCSSYVAPTHNTQDRKEFLLLKFKISLTAVIKCFTKAIAKLYITMTTCLITLLKLFIITILNKIM